MQGGPLKPAFGLSGSLQIFFFPNLYFPAAESPRDQLLLQFLQRNTLSFWIKKQHHKKLQQGNRREEDERQRSRPLGKRRKSQRNQRRTNPVGKAAQALSLGAHPVRKHLADVNPNNRALRKREERDVKNEQPDQQFDM